MLTRADSTAQTGSVLVITQGISEIILQCLVAKFEPRARFLALILLCEHITNDLRKLWACQWPERFSSACTPGKSYADEPFEHEAWLVFPFSVQRAALINIPVGVH